MGWTVMLTWGRCPTEIQWSGKYSHMKWLLSRDLNDEKEPLMFQREKQ